MVHYRKYRTFQKNPTCVFECSNRLFIIIAFMKEQQNSKIIDFLSSLNENELAYFYFYKLKTHSDQTQKKIEEYYREINFDPIKIESIIDRTKNEKFVYNKKVICCPRCKSSKTLLQKIDFSCGTVYKGYDYYLYSKRDEITVYTCNVCDYRFSSPRSLFYNLKLFFRTLWNRIF